MVTQTSEESDLITCSGMPYRDHVLKSVEFLFYEWMRACAGTRIVMWEKALNPVSKMNNCVMFGKDEKEWREYTGV